MGCCMEGFYLVIHYPDGHYFTAIITQLKDSYFPRLTEIGKDIGGTRLLGLK